MTTGPVRYVKGSGRMTPILITPTEDITAPHPTCTLCTWVAVASTTAGELVMRVKYLSASCHVHKQAGRTSAW